MLPILQLGPLAIPLPAMTVLAGLWIGMEIAERRSIRCGIRADNLVNLLLGSLLAGLVAARLGYVVRYPEAFRYNIWDIFSRNPGLLDPFIGIFTGCLFALVYGQRKKLPLLNTLDALTPFLAVVSISYSMANLFSGNAYGIQSDLPWAIELLGTRRHPSQVYDLLAGSIILFVVITRSQNEKVEYRGVLFLNFVAMSSFARIILEAFRANSSATFYDMRIAQIISWIILAFCTLLLTRLRQETFNLQHSNGDKNE